MGSPRSTRAQLGAAVNTCFAFWVALSAVPMLAVSFVAVRVAKHFWLRVLSSRYPLLQFVRTDTVRSLLDTHRNQGIINVLLCVKGSPDPEQIKAHLLEHVIDRRSKRGELAFPRMRAALVSCWGNYAWDVHAPFRLDNHFIVSSGVFRGRPITDANIQEYVSDVVSKYFPNDQPPWQYIVVPCLSPETKYYILVRVHHLLLTGENSINIGDLLLIEQSTEVERSSAPVAGGKISPLAELFPAPSAIPELYAKICESCSNIWNEFVSEYDPVESPRALKSSPGALHCAGLALLVAVGALREVNKRRAAGGSRDAASILRLLIAALRYECARREITPGKVLLSPLVTLDPRKWPPRILSFTAALVKFTATWPLRLRDEIASLSALRSTGHPTDPRTLTWRWCGVGLLAWRAAAEAWRGAAAALRAPGQLWHDAVRAEAGRTHALQTTSLCGRKVTAWSRGVRRASLERAAAALGVSGAEVALHASCEALRAHFAASGQPAPSAVLTTARAATLDFLLAYSDGDGKHYKKSQTGGMVCVALPLGAAPERAAAALERACRRQAALAGVWAAQARCGALTRALPSPAARLALNALSRRYAVSYAEISSPVQARARRTAWGHPLDHVIYWRPPQANISMSLTVIQYADMVHLAVMADARLSPHHSAAAARFPRAIDELLAQIQSTDTQPTANTDRYDSSRQTPTIREHGNITQTTSAFDKQGSKSSQKTPFGEHISRDTTVLDKASSTAAFDQYTSYSTQNTPAFDEQSGHRTQKTPFDGNQTPQKRRIERDVAKVDASHAHFRPQTFLTANEIQTGHRPSEPSGRDGEDVCGVSETAMLRAPPPEMISPPPVRRRMFLE